MSRRQDLSKYAGKGMTGLDNLGNTCFLNSCMQVLNHTYELNAFLDAKKYERVLKKGGHDAAILVEWNDLRNVMWSGNGVVTPSKFVHHIQHIARIKNRDIFTGYAQNDMPEFLLFFMDCMHMSICRGVNVRINGQATNDVDTMAVACYEMLRATYAREYSEIMELFYGIYVSEILSVETGEQRTMKPEFYFMLDLPVFEMAADDQGRSGYHLAGTLDECFQFYCKPEVLDGSNAWFNEKTGQKENVQKRISFWNFPEVLVIALKRFTPDGQQKINSRVVFPLTGLDLSGYVRGYNAASYQYDLFGVCNHMGGVMGGHYTAFVKNSEEKWIHFNDRNVDVIENLDTLVSPMAYCLFYRKVKT